LPLSGDRKPVPFLQTEFNENQGQFSPDGRWMAYTSDDSGIEQIYIQPFPASGGKRLISSSGGGQPRWRGDGKELFYISPDRQLMAVSIRTGSDSSHCEVGVPTPLFQAGIRYSFASRFFYYDVTADGQRFLVNTVPEAGSLSTVTVVVNWQAGFKQ
jgi:eukaryotic-like serine/threonine-protein kinase